MSIVRTRFAPSPTGRKHLGNLRTGMYAYLFAKKKGGKFILRIEDTDQERFVEGGTEALTELFDRLGIPIDESPVSGGDYGPYIQSQRLDLYKEHAEILLKSGHAYKCFCTKERLAKMREDQKVNKQPTGYDGLCLTLTETEVAEKIAEGLPYVIRMKFPKEGETQFEDAVYGKMKIKNNSIDDQVLMKADGFPTYHFAVVVDDHYMNISHVIRGREYLADTPKNIFLFKAFGWDVPVFAHPSHVLNSDGKGKLSTRKGALYALGYLRKGYLPEALINYTVLAGWYPKPEDTKQDEIYSVQELIDIFSLEQLQRTNARYDPKKLDYISGKHIRALTNEQLAEKIFDWAENTVLFDFVYDKLHGLDEWEAKLREEVAVQLKLWKADPALFSDALKLIHERLVYFSELPGLLQFIYAKELSWTDEDWKLNAHTKAEAAEALNSLKSELDTLYNSKVPTHDEWEQIVRGHADSISWKHGELFMALRSAVTGKLQSPPLFESIEAIGWEKSKKHIEDAIAWLKA